MWFDNFQDMLSLLFKYFIKLKLFLEFFFSVQNFSGPYVTSLVLVNLPSQTPTSFFLINHINNDMKFKYVACLPYLKKVTLYNILKFYWILLFLLVYFETRIVTTTEVSWHDLAWLNIFKKISTP